MTDLETPKARHRSVSQVNQYDRCPYSYKLQRLDKAWQKPAAWLPQGSAFHTVAEVIWRRKLAGDPMTHAEAIELFNHEYSKEVEEYTDITPNFEYWFASGRYRGEEDIERRYDIGLGQVAGFMTWTRDHPEEEIWITPDGTPAIELAFDIDLDGVLVRGYIDAVIQISETYGDYLIVRDYKTGKSPGDEFQLAVYAIAIAEQYEHVVTVGDYWMAQQGKPTLSYDLSEWTRERVAQRFRQLDDDVNAGRFDPKPSPSNCRFCSVAAACEYREY